MAIDVDWVTKIIYVPKSYLTLVQSVPTEIRSLDIDQFRHDLKDLEASVVGAIYMDTHRHSPEVTVGGVTLARVVEIINGYTVTFEDGQYAVNLLGANSNIADITNVNQVSVRSSNSAGLVSQTELVRNTDVLKRLVTNPGRGHGVFGQVFYWDPLNGNDNNAGNTTESAVLTWGHIQTITGTDGDVIFLLDSSVDGYIVIDDTIEITKNRLSLRGPGRSVMIKPTGVQTAPTIRITGNDVNLSGFIIETSATTNSQPCISVEGRASVISECWIYRGGTHGVEYLSGDYHLLSKCHIEKNVLDGVFVNDLNLSNGSPRELDIDRCAIYLNSRDGVRYEAVAGPPHTSTRLNSIVDSVIRNNDGVGVNIGANVWKTLIRGSVTIQKNGTDIVDNGDETTYGDSVQADVTSGKVRPIILPLYSKL